MSKSAFWGITCCVCFDIHMGQKNVTAKSDCEKTPSEMSTNCTGNWHLQCAIDTRQCVFAPPSPGSSPSSVGYFSQQHALQLPDPAFLWQRQTLLCSLLFLQQLLDVAGGAQQDVASGLHGEDGPPQSLPGGKAQREEAREAGHK